MNNFFIAQPPFHTKKIPSVINLLNKGIKKAGYSYTLKPKGNPFTDMNSIEQRSNYYLLVDSVIANEIAGDLIEVGTFTGQCAMIFQKTIEQHESSKVLHVYDNFQTQFAIEGSVEAELKKNFQDAGLQLPVIHKGNFEDTIPATLPDQISFAHIDCGYGGDKFEHRDIILYCLDHIYPRMTKGGICILMDYHDATIIPDGIGLDVNPGVTLACDEFLKDRPEQMTSLYANEASHAFFRKK